VGDEMKTRSGFVSNSSSSSFIVVFDKPLEEYEDNELKKKMFGTCSKKVKEKYSGKSLSTDDLLKTVRANAEELIANDDGSFTPLQIGLDECSDVILFRERYWDKVEEVLESRGIHFGDENYWDSWNEVSDSLAKERNKAWIMSVKDEYGNNAKFYKFEFCDHTDIGAFLEHSNIFDKFKYLYRNNH